MSLRSERFLHWWASITVVIMGLVVATPKDLMPATNSLPIWAQALGGILGAIAAGFYFRILFECVFRQSVPRRALWPILLLILPVISSIAYFMTTRSVLFQCNMSNSQGSEL